MITVNEKSHNVFKPVSITLTFHDQESLNKMASMFNYSPICDYMKNENFYAIRHGLQSIGADVSEYVHDIDKFINNHPCISKK